MIEQIQNSLKEENACYLLYSFRDENSFVKKILGLDSIITRKFVAIITPDNIITILPEIEKSKFLKVPGEIQVYKTYEQFNHYLEEAISIYSAVYLDYVADNNIATLDKVPYGLVELIKDSNITIKSSHILNSQFLGKWGADGYKSHKKAVGGVERVHNKLRDFISLSLKKGRKLRDYDILKMGQRLLSEEQLYNDDGNIFLVASGKRTSDPHYWPTEERNYLIEKNSPLIVDIWAKSVDEGSIYADFTFFYWIGPEKIPSKLDIRWNRYKEVVDGCINLITTNIDKGIKGYEVDLYAQDEFSKYGYDKNILHRTGHSIDYADHGSGTNIDNLESKDERLITPDTGFSIEPGLYFSDYGIRSELNVYITNDRKVEITTPVQENILEI